MFLAQMTYYTALLSTCLCGLRNDSIIASSHGEREGFQKTVMHKDFHKNEICNLKEVLILI